MQSLFGLLIVVNNKTRIIADLDFCESPVVMLWPRSDELMVGFHFDRFRRRRFRLSDRGKDPDRLRRR